MKLDLKRPFGPNDETFLVRLPAIMLSIKFIVEAVEHSRRNQPQLRIRQVLSKAIPRPVAKGLEYSFVVVLELRVV